MRYYVAAEALRRGINVLMSDTDVVINTGEGRNRPRARSARRRWLASLIGWGCGSHRADFYAVVKKPPFNNYNMFIMTVNPCPNGGMWCGGRGGQRE